MIRVIIIDDEPLARDIVKNYLKPYPQVEVIDECNDGFEAMKAIAKGEPDLIFLDVQMPKINGFELLELLDVQPQVVFTTAFDEFAIRAFEVNAIDYLLKPFDRERFDKAMQKLLQKVGQEEEERGPLLDMVAQSAVQNNRVVVKLDGAIKIIPVHDIDYIEAADDNVKISTRDGAYMKNKTMQFFEQSLPSEQFARVHRSYIINVAEVTRIELKEKESYLALLKSGIWIPVSRTGYMKLKVVLGL